MTRRRAFTNADALAIERALRAEGIDPDFFGAYDLLELWDRGCSPAQVVDVAKKLGAPTIATTGSER